MPKGKEVATSTIKQGLLKGKTNQLTSHIFSFLELDLILSRGKQPFLCPPSAGTSSIPETTTITAKSPTEIQPEDLCSLAGIVESCWLSAGHQEKKKMLENSQHRREKGGDEALVRIQAA